MNRKELIDAFANNAHITKKDAKELYMILEDTVVDSLKNTGKVQLFNGLSIEVREQNARECRNPRTGETMMVASKNVPKAKFGKKFKEAVL